MFETSRAPQWRIVVLGANPILGASLCRLIADDASIGCEAQDAAAMDAAEAIAAAAPDAVLMDVGDPVEALATLRAAGAECHAVAYLAGGASREQAAACLAAGFAGVVSQSSGPQCVICAVRAALAGGIYLDRRFVGEFGAAEAAGGAAASLAANVVVLSIRERSVLELLATGCSNKEIAAELGVSEKTVETYRQRGCAKLGLTGRRAVFEYARSAGWL